MSSSASTTFRGLPMYDHTIQIRQLDVEQDDLRPQDSHGIDGPRPIRPLTTRQLDVVGSINDFHPCCACP